MRNGYEFPEKIKTSHFFFNLGRYLCCFYRTFTFFIGKTNKTDSFQELCLPHLFIIYTSMRLSSYLWELVVFRNHVQSMDINIRHLRFVTIYFIQNPIFSKKYFKAISGQIFMKFISRHAEFLEFYFLSDNNFCLHGFCFLLI